MIYQLMKRDMAWKAARYAVPASFALGILFGTRNIPVAFSSTFFIFVAVFVGVGQLAETPFLSSLPVRVADIYTARALSMAALLWLSLAAAAPFIRRIGPVTMTAVAFLTILTLQSVSIRRNEFAKRSFLALIPVLSGGEALRAIHPEWLSGGPGIWIAAICVAASGGLFAWRRATVPQAFEIAPRTQGAAVPERKAPSEPTLVSGWRFPLIVYPWQYLLWIGILFPQVASSGFIGGVFLAFAFIALAQSGSWLHALPISRRLLLPILLIPALLSALAGVVAHSLPWSSQIGPRVVYVDENDCKKASVAVPLELWHRAEIGRKPVVRAPWGETTEPPVLEISGTEVYDPYSVGCGNSSRFFDWQYARAKAANAAPALRLRMLTMDTVLMLGLALFSLAAILTGVWRPMRRMPVPVRWAPAGIAFVGWMTLTLAPVLRLSSSIASPWGTWNARDFLVRLSWTLPGAWLLAAMVPVILLYLAVDKFFREAEFVNKKAAPVV